MTLWFDLLRLQQQRGEFGLTIPFLIGALRNPPGQIIAGEPLNYGELCTLLEQMRDANLSTQSVRIARCVKLHEPVAAIYNTGERMTMAESISTASAALTHLYVEQQYRGSGEVTDVVDKLWARIGAFIVSGAFSYQDGEYRAFSPADYDFINRARTMTSF